MWLQTSVLLRVLLNVIPVVTVVPVVLRVVSTVECLALLVQILVTGVTWVLARVMCIGPLLRRLRWLQTNYVLRTRTMASIVSVVTSRVKRPTKMRLRPRMGDHSVTGGFAVVGMCKHSCFVGRVGEGGLGVVLFLVSGLGITVGCALWGCLRGVVLVGLALLCCFAYLFWRFDDDFA